MVECGAKDVQLTLIMLQIYCVQMEVRAAKRCFCSISLQHVMSSLALLRWRRYFRGLLHVCFGLCRALVDSGVSAEEVNYVNAHGTSTPVGRLLTVFLLVNPDH